MKLNDLVGIIVDEVSIYREVEKEKYEELYRGKLRGMPPEWLKRTVVVMGVSRSKMIVEIEVV